MIFQYSSAEKEQMCLIFSLGVNDVSYAFVHGSAVEMR